MISIHYLVVLKCTIENQIITTEQKKIYLAT